MPAKRREREIPDAWRESVASHLAKWAETQPRGKRTTRALASLLGVSNFTYTKLKNREGPLGIHVLVAVRDAIGVPLDELLGLPPIKAKGTEPLTPSELDGVRALLVSERPKRSTRPPRPKEKHP